MSNLSENQLLSLSPPPKPKPPYSVPQKYSSDVSPGPALGAIIGGGFMGSFVGLILGFVLAGVFQQGTTLREQHASQNQIWLTTIIICAIIGAIWLFSNEFSDDPVTAEIKAKERRQYEERMAEYKSALAKYERFMANWPEELERRKVQNAAILRAREERQKAQQAEAERLERQKEWEVNASRAYGRLLQWRTEFLADCVASHGGLKEDELERLYIEAYPHSPVSADRHMGCLHHYAGGYPIIAKIKHLLPPEIPKP